MKLDSHTFIAQCYPGHINKKIGMEREVRGLALGHSY